jgi:acetyl esterase/lipase
MAVLVFCPFGAEVIAQDRLAQPIVAPVPDSSRYHVQRDLLYRERDGRRFLMDVFTPASRPDDGFPVVVFVHGGPLPESAAPQGKDLGQYQSFGPFVTTVGLAGVIFSHGLSGLDAFQDARMDVENALEFLRENAKQLTLDPDRVCMVFVSAGGVFLAPFLARSPWLKCIVLYYSVLRPEVMEELGAGAVSDDQREGLDPFAFVSPAASAPALFIAEAGRDAAPINSDLRRFRDAASASGWRVDYWEHGEGPHGFDVFHPSERSREILQRTLEFLHSQLRPSGGGDG